MLPDRVSNPGPLTYESGALSIALRGPSREGVSGAGWEGVLGEGGVGRSEIKMIVALYSSGDGRMVRWCWVNFQYRSVLLISI